jgi:hypothetical protein
MAWLLHSRVHGGILCKGPSDLPPILKRDVSTLLENLASCTSQLLSSVSKPLGLFQSLNSLGDYLTYAQECNPEMADAYKNQFDKLFTDAEFGRQFLVGADPTIIERITDDLPGNFPVTDEMVAESLQRGLSIEEEIKVCINVFWHSDFRNTCCAGADPGGASGAPSRSWIHLYS